MVLSLPRKWVKQNHLKKGNELDVAFADDQLIISLTEKEKKPLETEIHLEEMRESAIRTMLVNLYRAGHDKIIVNYPGKKQNLSEIVNNHMLGFELFLQENNKYIIESVSEPSYDQFENIIRKMFFMLNDIIASLGKEEVLSQVNKIQNYDNFLKRCITKTIFEVKSKTFLWQFLSDLTHITREFYHLSQLFSKTKLTEEQIAFMELIKQMLALFQKAYFSRNLEQIMETHELEEIIISKRKNLLLKAKEPLIAYYLIHIARLVFLLNSPLIGMIEIEKTS